MSAIDIWEMILTTAFVTVMLVFIIVVMIGMIKEW